MILAQLYVLANKMQDITSKRHLITAFVEASTRLRADSRTYLPGTAPITTVFNGTAISDPLRELLVDIYAAHGHQAWTKEPAKIESFSKDSLYHCFYATLSLRPAPAEMPKKLSDAAFYANRLQDDE